MYHVYRHWTFAIETDVPQIIRMHTCLKSYFDISLYIERNIHNITYSFNGQS